VEPQNLRFGGGVSSTVFNPAVAAIVILVAVLMCCLPRKKMVVPFLLASILIPLDQILVLAGLHFPVLRILVLVGMIRIFFIKGRGRWNVFSGGLNNVDKSVILLSVVTASAGVLLFKSTQALIYQLGNLYTAFGIYFLLRCLIRDREDVVRVIRVFALMVVVLGSLMVFEHFAGWDPYALLGGARAWLFANDTARDGRIRATASFGTPILAGMFGAVLLPLFIDLWRNDRKQRAVAALGILGASVMVVASTSSTPLMGCAAGVGLLFLWPMRSLMRLVRWSLVGVLIALQIVMKAPVYHLITRVDISGSSYHRYALIHETVIHFWQWWLIGTNQNGNWGWDMWDTANQYVGAAITGGLLALILLIAILAYGFKYLGRARLAAADKREAQFFWALTSTLFAYAVSFVGVSLWDQSIVAWYALLAIIGAVAVPQLAKAARQQAVTTLNPAMAAAAPASFRWWEQPARQDAYPSLRRHTNKF
jgi:hypothetical protein